MSFLESTLKESDGKGSSNAVGHTGLVEVVIIWSRKWQDKLISSYNNITNLSSSLDKTLKECETKSRIIMTR